MDTALDLAAHIARTLDDLAIPYAVGGSVASMLYGEPRHTRDADLIVILDRSAVRRIAERFTVPSFYMDLGAATEAVESGTRFNIIHLGSGLTADIYVAADPVAEAQVVRHREMDVGDGRRLRFSPPEELIAKKLAFYGMSESDHHLRDIAAMLNVSPDEIDRARVGELADGLGLTHVWEAVLKRVDAT